MESTCTRPSSVINVPVLRTHRFNYRQRYRSRVCCSEIRPCKNPLESRRRNKEHPPLPELFFLERYSAEMHIDCILSILSHVCIMHRVETATAKCDFSSAITSGNSSTRCSVAERKSLTTSEPREILLLAQSYIVVPYFAEHRSTPRRKIAKAKCEWKNSRRKERIVKKQKSKKNDFDT